MKFKTKARINLSTLEMRDAREHLNMSHIKTPVLPHNTQIPHKLIEAHTRLNQPHEVEIEFEVKTDGSFKVLSVKEV